MALVQEAVPVGRELSFVFRETGIRDDRVQPPRDLQWGSAAVSYGPPLRAIEHGLGETIPLREFQREGVKALGAGFSAEPLLLTGRDREFVLLQVPPDDRSAVLDLTEGLAAVLALRQHQERAVQAGLDQTSMEDVEAEIRTARKSIRQRKRTA